MVQNIVENYKCPFCATTKVGEGNIDIVGAAGNTVNIDIHCPSCKKHFMIKTEVIHMELPNISPDTLKHIGDSFQNLKMKLGKKTRETSFGNSEKIQENDILDMRKALLEKSFSVEDLFSDSDKND